MYTQFDIQAIAAELLLTVLFVIGARRTRSQSASGTYTFLAFTTVAGMCITAMTPVLNSFFGGDFGIGVLLAEFGLAVAFSTAAVFFMILRHDMNRYQ